MVSELRAGSPEKVALSRFVPITLSHEKMLPVLSCPGVIGRPAASSLIAFDSSGFARAPPRATRPRFSSSGVSTDVVPGSSPVARAFTRLLTAFLRSGSRGQAGLLAAKPAACGGGRSRVDAHAPENVLDDPLLEGVFVLVGLLRADRAAESQKDTTGHQAGAEAEACVTHGDHPSGGQVTARKPFSGPFAIFHRGGSGRFCGTPSAALPPKKDSYKSPTTPATMATSARLKTYQVNRNDGVVMWNSTKSITAP
jgi:hypothetical protein